ncbi:uncharacterized protein Fot_47736 [Forsythia ovata]|uniref:Maturase K n=1 Tax=Forsythia ovata TaxID=205694 RepID=A0ABD1QR83_9LAMI
MPIVEDSWSVMHCWVLPTRSFVEFIMFSRMFVNALDAQFYDEHQKTGRCYLSLSKDKHCYSRLLELLINVWAYHSARRMVYVNPSTGFMHEQHKLRSRRGQMWVKWFQYSTLKSMDEDLAEESDSDHPVRQVAVAVNRRGSSGKEPGEMKILYVALKVNLESEFILASGLAVKCLILLAIFCNEMLKV